MVTLSVSVLQSIIGKSQSVGEHNSAYRILVSNQLFLNWWKKKVHHLLNEPIHNSWSFAHCMVFFTHLYKNVKFEGCIIFFLRRNMCVCHSVYRSSQTFMSQHFCRSIQRAIVICLDYRPVPILLLQCWKVAHWNAIKFPKNSQKSKKWLPKFQNLLPKSLDLFLWKLIKSFIFRYSQ